MKNIIVLGAGMVGSTMAIDMAKNHNVTLTDISMHVLEKAKKRFYQSNQYDNDTATDSGTTGSGSCDCDRQARAELNWVEPAGTDPTGLAGDVLGDVARPDHPRPVS